VIRSCAQINPGTLLKRSLNFGCVTYVYETIVNNPAMTMSLGSSKAKFSYVDRLDVGNELYDSAALVVWACDIENFTYAYVLWANRVGWVWVSTPDCQDRWSIIDVTA
jgi:hypothetical protein